MKHKVEELVNQKFGKLKIVAEAEPHVFPNGARHRQMLCACDCGSETVINLYNILSGNTKGCAFCAENTPKHRLSKLPEYRLYRAMISRCHDPSDKGFPNYGGRGIVVEDALLNSFEAFLEEVGRRPTKQHSLDRIDVNKNYERGNLRWALPSEQQHNKRKRKNSTSEFIGVCAVPNGWRVQLQKDGTRLLDTVVEDELLAAKLYDDVSFVVYGDRPNGTTN